MGFPIAAVKFEVKSKVVPFSLEASRGKLAFPVDVPPIWFARKGDALIFKLTMMGRHD